MAPVVIAKDALVPNIESLPRSHRAVGGCGPKWGGASSSNLGNSELLTRVVVIQGRKWKRAGIALLEIVVPQRIRRIAIVLLLIRQIKFDGCDVV